MFIIIFGKCLTNHYCEKKDTDIGNKISMTVAELIALNLNYNLFTEIIISEVIYCPLE